MTFLKVIDCHTAARGSSEWIKVPGGMQFSETIPFPLACVYLHCSSGMLLLSSEAEKKKGHLSLQRDEK